MVSLVSAIFQSGVEYQMVNARRSEKAGEAIIAILFYGFGLFVAHRYSTIGLRVVCIIPCLFSPKTVQKCFI